MYDTHTSLCFSQRMHAKAVDQHTCVGSIFSEKFLRYFPFPQRGASFSVKNRFLKRLSQIRCVLNFKIFLSKMKFTYETYRWNKVANQYRR